MDRVFETTLLETNFLVIYPYVTQMEASKSQNCRVVTGRELSFKGKNIGNCEEELPKKPVGRLSVNCRPTVDRQVTDSLPTG